MGRFFVLARGPERAAPHPAVAAPGYAFLIPKEVYTV